MKPGLRLKREFYLSDVLEVAPQIIGKYMVVRKPDGTLVRHRVTEVEAYRGTEDRACHAFKGKTGRTHIMFGEGGYLYVYLIYGMYWMLNIVTGEEENPQAVLIRGVESLNGPGKLTKALGIDKSFYGEDLTVSERIWFEETGENPLIRTSPRIGIDYAGEYWASKPWRYFI
jgi:DNA-3-methyladenine glycosylase